jgi:hypothetical protein
MVVVPLRGARFRTQRLVFAPNPCLGRQAAPTLKDQRMCGAKPNGPADGVGPEPQGRKRQVPAADRWRRLWRAFSAFRVKPTIWAGRPHPRRDPLHALRTFLQGSSSTGAAGAMRSGRFRGLRTVPDLESVRGWNGALHCDGRVLLRAWKPKVTSVSENVATLLDHMAEICQPRRRLTSALTTRYRWTALETAPPPPPPPPPWCTTVHTCKRSGRGRVLAALSTVQCTMLILHGRATAMSLRGARFRTRGVAFAPIRRFSLQAAPTCKIRVRMPRLLPIPASASRPGRAVRSENARRGVSVARCVGGSVSKCRYSPRATGWYSIRSWGGVSEPGSWGPHRSDSCTCNCAVARNPADSACRRRRFAIGPGTGGRGGSRTAVTG